MVVISKEFLTIYNDPVQYSGLSFMRIWLLVEVDGGNKEAVRQVNKVKLCR